MYTSVPFITPFSLPHIFKHRQKHSQREKRERKKTKQIFQWKDFYPRLALNLTVIKNWNQIKA